MSPDELGGDGEIGDVFFLGPEVFEAIKAAPAAPDAGGPGTGLHNLEVEGGAVRAFHGGRLSILRGPGFRGV